MLHAAHMHIHVACSSEVATKKPKNKHQISTDLQGANKCVGVLITIAYPSQENVCTPNTHTPTCVVVNGKRPSMRRGLGGGGAAQCGGWGEG